MLILSIQRPTGDRLVVVAHGSCWFVLNIYNVLLVGLAACHGTAAVAAASFFVCAAVTATHTSASELLWSMHLLHLHCIVKLPLCVCCRIACVVAAGDFRHSVPPLKGLWSNINLFAEFMLCTSYRLQVCTLRDNSTVPSNIARKPGIPHCTHTGRTVSCNIACHPAMYVSRG